MLFNTSHEGSQVKNTVILAGFVPPPPRSIWTSALSMKILSYVILDALQIVGTLKLNRCLPDWKSQACATCLCSFYSA